MVILGIALANLPFGTLADRYSIRPIIVTGGTVITVASLICATDNIMLLIVARFTRGLFIPSLTTCIAAYLARSLPAARLWAARSGSRLAATPTAPMDGMARLLWRS
jgi:YNFM family putative membrane transporter